MAFNQCQNTRLLLQPCDDLGSHGCMREPIRDRFSEGDFKWLREWESVRDRFSEGDQF